jgi:hypothetical protein
MIRTAASPDRQTGDAQALGHRPGIAIIAGLQRNQLLDGQGVRETRCLKHHSHPRTGRRPGWIQPEQPGSPAIGLNPSRQQPDRGRFSGAVRPQQRRDFARSDRKAQLTKNLDAPKPLRRR